MAKSDGGDQPAADNGPSEAVILVVCATHRDHRELPRIAPSGVKYLFHDYASTSLEDLICDVAGKADLTLPLQEMEAILATVAGTPLSGIITTDDYPGAALAAALAERLGFPGPDPAVMLICQHKYLARVEQKKLVPHAVPSFALIDVAESARLPQDLRFPLFVKPVKSFFSIGAERVETQSALTALFPRWAALDQFFGDRQRYALDELPIAATGI